MQNNGSSVAASRRNILTLLVGAATMVVAGSANALETTGDGQGGQEQKPCDGICRRKKAFEQWKKQQREQAGSPPKPDKPKQQRK